MQVRSGCRCTFWVQVTIGRRWKLNAGQNLVQVYSLDAGHNLAHMKIGLESELDAGVQLGQVTIGRR